MSRLTTSLIGAAVIGQLVGLLGWIDPLFIPLVLLAPVISGALAASRRTPYSWIAVLWSSAGLNMLWMDWVVNREDVGFHLVLAALMALLAGVGYGIVRLATRSRAAASSEPNRQLR
jgi:hypothetical protein